MDGTVQQSTGPRQTPAVRRSRPPGRPPDPAKRSAVVEAGWQLFVAHGVDGVSMESVAARAGVSKVTVYRYFADKSALFVAGVQSAVSEIEAAQGTAASAQPNLAAMALRERLRTFGIGIMEFLALPDIVACYATLSADLARHPALALQFWNAGPGHVRDSLAALLADAADRGEIECADADVAAGHLFGLWQGFTNLQYLLAIPITDDIDGRVSDAVDTFLRAYLPSPARRSNLTEGSEQS